MKSQPIYYLNVILALVLLSAGRAAADQQITLIEDGQDFAKIISDPDASVQHWEAVDELRSHIYKMTGVFLWSRPADYKVRDCEIVLGAAAAKQRCGLDLSRENLGEQGYIIRTIGQRLVIAGETDLGTLYGVYGFLEDHLGVRWFTPDFTKIPRRSALKIGPIDERIVPVFESRMLSWASGRRSIRWSSRMRTNCFIHNYGVHVQEFRTTALFRGLYHFVGSHCHTMDSLLSPTKYFDSHPEYFCEIDGKRIKEYTQPCLTNPDVIEIIAGNVMAWAGSSSLPNRIVSISQNDWGNACQCDRCAASYRKKGLSQTYIEFVNDIARQVGKKFPDVLVETLAYQWSRNPPKNLKLSPNMLIRYAGLVQCRRHGYQCEHSMAKHCKDWLDRWVDVSPRVWVWYYSGGQSLAPWVNLNAYGPDFRDFAKAGATGVFLEGSSWHPGIDLGVLKAYVLAKLSWNPNLDDEAIIQEFIDCVYGPAAAEVRRFIELVNDDASYLAQRTNRIGIGMSQQKSGQGIHSRAGLLRPQAVRQMFDACERAEQLAGNDRELLARIRLIRLSCDYLTIVYLSKDDPRWPKAIEKFFATAGDTGLSKFYSWDTLLAPWKSGRYASLEEFRRAIDSGAVADHIAKQVAERFTAFYGGKLLEGPNLDLANGPDWFIRPLHQEGKVVPTPQGLAIADQSYIAYPGTALERMRYTPFTIELDVKLSPSSKEQTIFLAGGGTDHLVNDPETIQISLSGQRIKVLIRSYQSGVAQGFAHKQVLTEEVGDFFGQWRHLAVTYQNNDVDGSMPHVFVDGRLIAAAQVQSLGQARITERFGWWKLGAGGFSLPENSTRIALDKYYSAMADTTYNAVSDCAPGLYRNVFFSNFLKQADHVP